MRQTARHEDLRNELAYKHAGNLREGRGPSRGRRRGCRCRHGGREAAGLLERAGRAVEREARAGLQQLGDLQLLQDRSRLGALVEMRHHLALAAEQLGARSVVASNARAPLGELGADAVANAEGQRVVAARVRRVAGVHEGSRTGLLATVVRQRDQHGGNRRQISDYGALQSKLQESQLQEGGAI